MRGTARKSKVPVAWVIPADVILVGWIGDALFPAQPETPESFESEILTVCKDGHGDFILTLQDGTTHPLPSATKCVRVKS